MRQKDGIPLNEYPLRIIKITIMDEQNNLVENSISCLCSALYGSRIGD
jgi:hypothetical protein